MNEDKHIPLLFEAARSETPRLSFEEVSQNFQASLSQGPLTAIKIWLKNYSLNILMFLMGSALIMGLFFMLSWKDETIVSERFAGVADAFIIQPIESQEVKIPEADLIINERKTQAFDQDLHVVKKLNSHKEKQITAPSIAPVLPIEFEEGKEYVGNQNTKAQAQDSLFNEKPSPNNFMDSVFKAEGENENSSPYKTKLNPKKFPEVRKSELSLVLLRKYNAEAVQKFLKKLRESGLGIEMGQRFQDNDKILDYFSLTFSHELGLDFELKGTGFQRLEIILRLDDEGQIQNFRYRFNEDEFTRRIPLTCIGYQTYTFGKGFAGKSGKSNVQIDY